MMRLLYDMTQGGYCRNIVNGTRVHTQTPNRMRKEYAYFTYCLFFNEPTFSSHNYILHL